MSGTSQPKPPFPKQKQESPGLESKLRPKPLFEARRYKAAGKLEGKVALITGGDSGIGRAVAVLYAKEKADVAIVYLPQEQSDAEETKRAVEEEGKHCLLLPGDLADPEFCRSCVEETVRTYGRLDILVNNAAYQKRKEKLEDVTTDEWRYTFQVNVESYFHLVQAAVPHLAPGSCIIASSSVTGLRGSAKLPDYSATKGAIISFSKTLAALLLEKGIRVNVVAPGPVWTPLNPADEGTSPEKIEEFGKDTPMGRPAQPEEIAPAYVFFASEADSGYMSGVVLPELGGEPTSAA